MVCRMNLDVVAGLLDGIGLVALEARLDPAAGRCCVALTPVECGDRLKRDWVPLVFVADDGKTADMQRKSLEALARQQLDAARSSRAGRAADTVFGGHENVLRQTVIGMVKDAVLSEHENPGEATVQVMQGRIRLTAGENSWDGRTGDLLFIPNERHSLTALEDSAILLTVAKIP